MTQKYTIVDKVKRSPDGATVVEQSAVRIDEGVFAGMVLSYDKVQFAPSEDEETCKLNFDIVIHKIPNGMKDGDSLSDELEKQLHEESALILQDVLEKMIESGELKEHIKDGNAIGREDTGSVDNERGLREEMPAVSEA